VSDAGGLRKIRRANEERTRTRETEMAFGAVWEEMSAIEGV
jgi:hypothetical protein